jgi:transcriptional regulator with XRE-family HTH domain
MSESQNLSGRGRKAAKVAGTSFRHLVANRMRDRRLELQLRAEEAASRASTYLGRAVSPQTWYHWEKAEHPFDIDALPAIAKALDWTPGELLPELEAKGN